jgi:hypothetical protein
MELAAGFRALSIMALLVQVNKDLFHQNLIRSGETRESYLQKLKQLGIQDDHHQASGRFEPLLDAVAGGDFELARRIAILSPVEWIQGHEYEDDFCYAQILHKLIIEPSQNAEISSLLLRFEAYLEGNANARFDICRALADKDQNAFDEAFDNLLYEHETGIAAAKARGQMEDPIVISQRLVFVEGLAILVLAEKRGLQTQSEYLYCPSLARL